MLTLRVTDRRDQGVSLISPMDPGFDEIARPLIGERVADLVLRLKPMLVIVTNESQRTIASLSVVWTTRYADGRTDTMWTHASFPSAVSGLGTTEPGAAGIAPGERRIEGKGIVVHGYGTNDPYYDQFLEQFEPQKHDGLHDARELSIDLNAVIFTDGTLIGPDDDWKLRDLFSRYVTAQQTWLLGVRDALDAGLSVPMAFGELESFQRQMSESRGAFPSRDPDQLWRIQTSADVVGWRRRHNDADIPALIRRLNLESFLIR